MQEPPKQGSAFDLVAEAGTLAAAVRRKENGADVIASLVDRGAVRRSIMQIFQVATEILARDGTRDDICTLLNVDLSDVYQEKKNIIMSQSLQTSGRSDEALDLLSETNATGDLLRRKAELQFTLQKNDAWDTVDLLMRREGDGMTRAISLPYFLAARGDLVSAEKIWEKVFTLSPDDMSIHTYRAKYCLQHFAPEELPRSMSVLFKKGNS